MKQGTEVSERTEKALHIAGVSGSFSILQLKWENNFDEIFGDIYEAETPLPSNFNKSRYQITKEIYDNYPIGYKVVLFCGNQGHPVKTNYNIATLEMAKECAQHHFNNLILNCLTEIRDV